MNRVYLQLGSNIGERDKILSMSAKLISKDIGRIYLSSKIYESTPWRVDGQENYLNQIVGIKTLFSAQETLDAILKIENQLGRIRVEKWGERLIDIDIIFFNNDIIETPELCIPHKYMHERNFVLEPLMEIAPNLIHPKYNKTVSELFNESKDMEKVVEYVI
tara:strand:- start:748 stop:1233 length:486 start_codon:yes stop_codon:yes gene_type:complete